MAVISLATAIGGLVSAIGGFLIWFNSLPNEFKYIIFLGGLTADAGLSTAFGVNQGLVGLILTSVISGTFGIEGFAITTWEVLVVFTFLPFVWFMLRNTLAKG